MFCLLCSKLDLVEPSEKSNTMKQFYSFGNLEMACCTARQSLSKLQYEDFKVICDEFHEFNGDYKSTVMLQFHSGLSDKKRTPKFVGKI